MAVAAVSLGLALGACLLIRLRPVRRFSAPAQIGLLPALTAVIVLSASERTVVQILAALAVAIDLCGLAINFPANRPSLNFESWWGQFELEFRRHVNAESPPDNEVRPERST